MEEMPGMSVDRRTHFRVQPYAMSMRNKILLQVWWWSTVSLLSAEQYVSRTWLGTQASGLGRSLRLSQIASSACSVIGGSSFHRFPTLFVCDYSTEDCSRFFPTGSREMQGYLARCFRYLSVVLYYDRPALRWLRINIS
jgi:hypothetical protein